MKVDTSDLKETLDRVLVEEKLKLRDTFAAAALSGLIFRLGVYDEKTWAAQTAYEYADAMLAERDKEK